VDMEASVNESADIGTRTRRVCSVCSKKEAPYRCPKCHVAYCSKDCYEGHNKSCVEQFNQSLTEALRNVYASDSERKRMQEVLERHWNECDNEQGLDSEDETELLEEALRRVDVEEPEQVFASLPEKLQRKFQRLLANGDIDDLVEVWKPWWEEEDPIIIEIGIEDSNTKGVEGRAVQCEPEQLQLKKEPAATLNLHVLEVCYAYCYCMRFFNGDLYTDCLDSFQCLVSISKVLSEDRRYSSISEVFYSVLHVSRENIHYSNSRNFTILIFRDTRMVVSRGQKGIMRVLEETEALARAARQEQQGARYHRDWLKTVFKVEKKIGYFKTFVKLRWKDAWTTYFSEKLKLFEEQQLEHS